MAFNYGRWSINDVIYTPFIQNGVYFCPFAYKDYFINFNHIRHNAANNYYNDPELDAVQFNIKFVGDTDVWTHPSANYSLGLPAIASTSPLELPVAILRDPSDTAKQFDKDDIIEVAPYAALIYPRYKRDWEKKLYFLSANSDMKYTPVIDDTTVLSYYVDPDNGTSPGPGIKKFPRVSVIGLDANTYPTVNVPILGKPVGVEVWFSPNDAQVNDQVSFSGYTHHTIDSDLYAPHFLQKASNGHIRRYVCGWVRADADPATLTGADIMCGTLAEGTNSNVWIETYVNGEYFPKLYTDANAIIDQIGRYDPIKYRAESIDPYEIPEQRIYVTLTAGSNDNIFFGYSEGFYGSITSNTIPREVALSGAWNYTYDKINNLYESDGPVPCSNTFTLPVSGVTSFSYNYIDLPVGYRGLSTSHSDPYRPNFDWGQNERLRVQHDESNYIEGEFDSADQANGIININIDTSVGSGTYDTWNISILRGADCPSPAVISDFKILEITSSNAETRVVLQHTSEKYTDYYSDYDLEFNLSYVKFIDENGTERYYRVHQFPLTFNSPKKYYNISSGNTFTFTWTSELLSFGRDWSLDQNVLHQLNLGNTVFANNQTYTIELGFDKNYGDYWTNARYFIGGFRPATDRAVTRLYCDTQPWERLTNFVFSNSQLANDAFASYGSPADRNWGTLPTNQTYWLGYDTELDMSYNNAQTPPDANGQYRIDSTKQAPKGIDHVINDFVMQLDADPPVRSTYRTDNLNLTRKQTNFYYNYASDEGRKYDYANFNCFDVKWVTYLDYVADDGEGAHVATLTIPLPRMHTHPGYANTVSFAPMMTVRMVPFPWETYYYGAPYFVSIKPFKSQLIGNNWKSNPALMPNDRISVLAHTKTKIDASDSLGSITQDAVQYNIVCNGSYNNWNISFNDEYPGTTGNTYYDYWFFPYGGSRGLGIKTGNNPDTYNYAGHLVLTHTDYSLPADSKLYILDDWGTSALRWMNDAEGEFGQLSDLNPIENRWEDQYLDFDRESGTTYQDQWDSWALKLFPRYFNYTSFFEDNPTAISTLRDGHQHLRGHFKWYGVSQTSVNYSFNTDIPLFDGVWYIEQYFSPNERRRNPYAAYSGYTKYRSASFENFVITAGYGEGNPFLPPGTTHSDRHIEKIRWGVFDREADANTVVQANCRFGIFLDYDATSNTTTANLILNGNIINTNDYSSTFFGSVTGSRTVPGNVNSIYLNWTDVEDISTLPETIGGLSAYPDDKIQNMGYIDFVAQTIRPAPGTTDNTIEISFNPFREDTNDPGYEPTDPTQYVNAFRSACFDTYDTKYLCYVECSSPNNADGHYGFIDELTFPEIWTHPGWNDSKNYNFYFPNRNYDYDIQWSDNENHSLEAITGFALNSTGDSLLASSGIHPSTPTAGGKLPYAEDGSYSVRNWYKDVGEPIISASSNGEQVFVRFEDSYTCGGNNHYVQKGYMKGLINKSGFLTINVEGSVEDNSTNPNDNYDALVIMLNASGWRGLYSSARPIIGEYGRFGILLSAGSNANAAYRGTSTTRSPSLCNSQKSPDIINYISSGYYVEANDEIIIFASTTDNVSHQGSHYNVTFTIT